MKNTEHYSTAIIGAGIAGISAAIYLQRAGISPLLFESTAISGQLMYIDRIDNYPGLPIGSKAESLRQYLQDSLTKLEIKIKEDEIISLEQENNFYILKSKTRVYSASTVIIATGATFKKLAVPGEEKFAGRGVSWCAICDGFFFRNKQVAVIGGGNTAAEEAIYLSSLAEKVYLIHRRNQLRAVNYLQEEIKKRKNIEIIWDSEVLSINGETKVEGISLIRNKKEKFSLNVDGVFIAIGVIPKTAWLNGKVKCDDKGFILTDEYMQTSLPGVFACGDCRLRPLRQLITAAAEGAVAALSAYRNLKGDYLSC